MTREEALYQIAEMYLNIPWNVVREHLTDTQQEELIKLHRIAYNKETQ